jgi:hypothetical protein
MATTVYGFGGLNNRFNSTNNFQSAEKLKGLFTEGRVSDIILTDSHTLFSKFGEWNSIGTIQFTSVSNPGTSLGTAKPLFPNIKNYPLINEIVYLLDLSNTEIGINSTSTNIYYINIVGLWNHPHHNAYPINSTNLPESQQKDYEQTSVGSVRRVLDKSTEILLGQTFKEKTNIHPLQAFEGDIIYEGRWGNSIRFGSTVKTKGPIVAPLNNWSSGSEDSGNPILIIRNGQGQQSKEGWLPITENINNDASSIYLTSTQKIPLEVASKNYNSYNTQPEQPDVFDKEQIIVNSNRVVLNSKKDHTLLSSAKSINLNAVESVNLDSPKTIVDSNKIYLGSKDAVEPLLLGESTYCLLDYLIDNLQAFSTVVAASVPVVGENLGPINLAASQLSAVLKTIKTELSTIKSNVSYTI